MKFDKKQHPIIKELKERIAECKYQLLQILEEWHYLQNDIQPRLIFTYESLFGGLESELRIKNQVASELDRRVELLSVKLKNGEKLNEHTIDFIDRVVRREAEIKSKIESKPHIPGLKVPFCSVNENYELPQIYRKLVKRLHPDAVGEESPEYKKFWTQIQTAYQNKDVDKLHLYAKTLLINEEAEIKDIRTEKTKLSTEIHDLEVNIKNAKAKLQMLKSEEPFTLEEKLNDERWVAHKQRMLKDRIFYLDRQIFYKEKMLKSLTNGQYIAEKTENGNIRFIKREIAVSYAM